MGEAGEVAPVLNLVDRIPKDRRGVGGGRKVGSKATGGLASQKMQLRLLALRLAVADDPRARKEVRKKLEIISLLYAAKSEDGEEFRKSAQLAVDLSGYKLEQREKIKERQKKSADGKRRAARVTMVEREDREVGKTETF